MNFSLEHFELHFSTDLLPAGEQLYELGAILIFEEIEHNLWAFQIKDTDQFEVEILISPSRVLNFSCDCEYFRENKECRHVIASLFHLRMVKTKKVAIKPVATTEFFPRKLSIPNILNQVNPNDLKNFLRSYAKKNKHFATALKANFARKIDLQDNEEKYESILNSIVKPATGVDYRIGFSTIKQFLTIAAQFEGQFEDALSLKQYKEGFFIIKSVLGKAAYINHWTGSEKEDILLLNAQYHKHYSLFLEMEIPPSLKSDLIKFGLELAGRSYYHITDPDQNTLTILMDHIESGKESQLVDILKGKMKQDQLHYKELEFLWIIRQYFFEKNYPLETSKTPRLGSQSIYRICDHLFDKKNYYGLKNFIELFSVNGVINDLFLLKKYIEVLDILNKDELLISTCLESIYIHKDLFFYEVLCEKYPEQKDAFYASIEAKIKGKRLLSTEMLLLKILEYDQKTDDLLNLILTSKNNLSLLYQSAPYIYANTDQMTSISITVIDLYLSEFMGRESAVEMRKFLVYLRQNHMDDIFSKVKKHLNENYKDRRALLEEIKDLRL